MNEYQKKLYSDLVTLVGNNEAFYFQDFEHPTDGGQYRIFNYRLASYSDFLQPSALQCRGTMFEIQGDGYDAIPIRLAALPMEKFFNLNENPFTIGVDLTQIVQIEDKADGSLISTYLDRNNQLALKSKGSIASDQAVDATTWLNDHPLFKQDMEDLDYRGFTVNLEWVAPFNRIVIGYEKAELRVLNIRDRITGNYVDRFDLNPERYEEVFLRWTAHVDVDSITSEEFVASIPDMTDIEGFVVRLRSGQRIKIKTSWYLALHHTKDNINSPRRLFEAVLEEATDDMKTLFFDDPLALKTIDEMEKFVEKKYNHMVDTVERFYERNKDLDRKEYAILGQEELKETMFFSLAMNRYLGKEFSYKDFLKSKWKQLGLKDVEKNDEK